MLTRSIQKVPIAILAIGLLFAINASSALAAPTITTENATEPAATTATFHATLSLEGHPTEYQFRYGTSPELYEMNDATPTQSIKGKIYTPIPVTERATGLKPSTTYYYAVFARTDKNEWLYGGNKTFTTSPSESGMQFMAAKYPTSVIMWAGKARVFEALGGLFHVDCTFRPLYGNLSAPSNSISLEPAFTECTGPQGTVTFKKNSCRYVFDIDHNWGVYAGSFAVTCSKEGDAVEFNSTEPSGCDVKLLPQEIPHNSWVFFENTGSLSSRIITAGGWATNLKWTASGGCSASGEDGSLGSLYETTIRGESGLSPVELFVNGVE